MALQGTRILCSTPITTPYAHSHLHRPILFRTNLSTSSRTSHTVSATRKLSSRPGKFDSKNKRSSSAEQRTDEIDGPDDARNLESADVSNENFDGYFLPKLPGDEPDFWEGPQWDAFGFFIQYLWAFGIVFALISSGIAVATYNEGATDFKETPAYKESIESGELLEAPEESNSDVFETNPTEVAPSLE